MVFCYYIHYSKILIKYNNYNSLKEEFNYNNIIKYMYMKKYIEILKFICKIHLLSYIISSNNEKNSNIKFVYF